MKEPRGFILFTKKEKANFDFGVEMPSMQSRALQAI
jgi:hypothetical protein